MFVCHGNICRSPMAEFLFRELVNSKGQGNAFTVASSATSTEELGNPVYPPVKRLLAGLGISCDEKRATQLRFEDGDKYDLFLCMDDSNLVKAKRILGLKNAEKCCKALSIVGESRDVADPWYTRDFEASYRDIVKVCEKLLKE